MEDLIKSILGKVSSYQLFNYTFTGGIFLYLLELFFQYDLFSQKLIIVALISYYAGLVISRVGSLIIEPLLKWIKFIKFADYPDFIKASKKDKKLEVLSSENNMYRTFCAIFIVLLCTKLYEYIAITFDIPNNVSMLIFILSQFVLFLFSYRKQTSYVRKRVEITNASSNE